LDGCEAATKDFDVLGWWKINAPKYHIIAAIARNVLAMPIFTVASESAFSTKGHILVNVCKLVVTFHLCNYYF